MKNLRSLIVSTVVLFGTSVMADTFEQATRAPYSPPAKKSINGKSIEHYKTQVQKEWANILFKKNGLDVNYSVVLKTDAGDISIRFYPKEAPNHVKSFIALAKSGFYDGLIFHRCIPGFVIQGGCPLGSGTGGPGYCVNAEFNQRKHVRGILSMARARPADSAGSQFFVCVADTPSLNNQYTVFGKVTKGMDVVDKIVKAPRDGNDRPIEPVTIKKAVVSIVE